MKDTTKDTLVLVTGGTGFVGIHAILQLMQKGYGVKTTLRSFKRKDEIISMLQNGGLTDFENLQFIEADLTKDDHWDDAVKGCTYVLHIASPIFLALPKDENEMATINTTKKVEIIYFIILSLTIAVKRKINF